MSQPPNIGTTLTGGIQDIAALLPLLGTDQCEKHVGSALEGGYLYAAAAPLSIFGSLGVVKIGISVRRWLGARILDNAGFKPVGTVAPLIAMDETRYMAETRLMEILKEKHIDDPERVSVEWKSTEWNVMLVLCIMVAAVCSVTLTLPSFHRVFDLQWCIHLGSSPFFGRSAIALRLFAVNSLFNHTPSP